jgi:hypothetical protein
MLSFYIWKGVILMGRSRGNKPLEKNSLTNPEELYCAHCNELRSAKDFYDSDSEFYKATGKIPYCKSCIDEFYHNFLNEYKKQKYSNPERKAIERVCMALDFYYSDKIFDSAMKESLDKRDTTLMVLYCKNVKLYQYRKKNYDTTILERFEKTKDENSAMLMAEKAKVEYSDDIKKSVKFFGSGFEIEDYMYLQEQYDDWTTRHECQTKSQEELFKQICFAQLNLLKAQRQGEDTKDLNKTYLDLLNAGKLQPKQTYGETVADNQTFGTLIDKWENTRPIPEIDEELRDVDKIGLYVDTFFKGHLAKTMGLKNGFSNLYTKFMKKYTVEKPEYNDDSDGEALFDAIFGGSNLDKDDD